MELFCWIMESIAGSDTRTTVTINILSVSLLCVQCIVIFVGTLAAFRRVYEDPILTSRQPAASSEERLLGQNRARELNRITSLFILRRTQDVNKYLPPRGFYYFDDFNVFNVWYFYIQLLFVLTM